MGNSAASQIAADHAAVWLTASENVHIAVIAAWATRHFFRAVPEKFIVLALDVPSQDKRPCPHPEPVEG